MSAELILTAPASKLMLSLSRTLCYYFLAEGDLVSFDVTSTNRRAIAMLAISKYTVFPSFVDTATYPYIDTKGSNMLRFATNHHHHNVGIYYLFYIVHLHLQDSKLRRKKRCTGISRGPPAYLYYLASLPPCQTTVRKTRFIRSWKPNTRAYHAAL
jgi:hypothetical protein